MPTNKTCYSLFSGCGGSDNGLKMAGYDCSGGIEYHAPAADIYDANHQIPLIRANVLDIGSIPTVDITWASPPCPGFSLANKNKGETDRDIKLAKHIANLMVKSRPRSIAIENVRGYWGSQSCNLIMESLENAGYNIKYSVECAANYGAATTRRRLIIRASLDRIKPLVHTHQKPTNNNQQYLFDRLPNWISWHDAIESFIHELPKSSLTENQLNALAQQKPQLISKYQTSILIERLGYHGQPNIYSRCVPCPTIRAHTHIDDHGCYRVATNIINKGECYAADIRCLAAWQSFPDSFNWLENKGEAGRSIGNSVPVSLALSVALSFNSNESCKKRI